MSWETSSHRSYASTLLSSPDDPEQLAQDVVRMDKVHRKLKALIVQRGPNGIPGFTRSFQEIDRTWAQRLTMWEFRKFFQSVDVKLNGKDLEALFIYYDTDGDGELDYADFLVSLRSRLDMTQQQIEDILRKVRLRLLQRCKENPRGALLGALQQQSPTTLSRAQFLAAMAALSLGVKQSDFQFLFYHLSNTGTAPFPYIEVAKLADDLLSDPSSEQQLDNLHQKLIDAMKDRDRTTSGTAGLLRVLKKADSDRRGQLPGDEFRRAMKAFGCALLDKEIDQIFSYYCDAATQRVAIPDFIRAMRDAMGADDPPEVVAHLFTKLRTALTWRGAQGILALSTMFDKYSQGSGCLTLWECVSALRDVGVGGALADVELETMFNAVAEDYDVLRARRFLEEVRGEVPVAKLDMIQQAWDRLDPAGRGTCAYDTLLNAFKPSKMPDVQGHRKSEKDMLTLFAEAFQTPTGVVDKASFVAFWCNFSVSVLDPNEFNLLLWTTFDLSKQPLARNRMNAEPQAEEDRTPMPRPGRRPFGAAPPSPPPKAMPVPQPALPPSPPAPPLARPAGPAFAPLSPAATQSIRSSGGYATRRTPQAQDRRRPLSAGPPTTPPRAAARAPSPVPSPTYSPDVSGEKSAPPPFTPPRPGRPIPNGSVGRGSERSCGGGETQMNLFGAAAPPTAAESRVTGSRGRHVSDAARREFNKERPF